MTKEELGQLILSSERQLYATAKTILADDQDCADAIQESIVKAFSKRTLGMAGIDFLIDEQERWIFNELEEMVGCRMLYQTTSKDIVKDYVRWIKRFV